MANPQDASESNQIGYLFRVDCNGAKDYFDDDQLERDILQAKNDDSIWVWLARKILSLAIFFAHRDALSFEAHTSSSEESHNRERRLDLDPKREGNLSANERKAREKDELFKEAGFIRFGRRSRLFRSLLIYFSCYVTIKLILVHLIFVLSQSTTNYSQMKSFSNWSLKLIGVPLELIGKSLNNLHFFSYVSNILVGTFVPVLYYELKYKSREYKMNFAGFRFVLMPMRELKIIQREYLAKLSLLKNFIDCLRKRVSQMQPVSLACGQKQCTSSLANARETNIILQQISRQINLLNSKRNSNFYIASTRCSAIMYKERWQLHSIYSFVATLGALGVALAMNLLAFIFIFGFNCNQQQKQEQQRQSNNSVVQFVDLNSSTSSRLLFLNCYLEKQSIDWRYGLVFLELSIANAHAIVQNGIITSVLIHLAIEQYNFMHKTKLYLNLCITKLRFIREFWNSKKFKDQRNEFIDSTLIDALIGVKLFDSKSKQTAKTMSSLMHVVIGIGLLQSISTFLSILGDRATTLANYYDAKVLVFSIAWAYTNSVILICALLFAESLKLNKLIWSLLSEVLVRMDDEDQLVTKDPLSIIWIKFNRNEVFNSLHAVRYFGIKLTFKMALEVNFFVFSYLMFAAQH